MKGLMRHEQLIIRVSKTKASNNNNILRYDIANKSR